MAERRIPTRAEVLAYLHEQTNWGRWGKDDQLGAINLITPEKKVKAASLVRSGRSLSLSRPFPKAPKHGNPHPAQHWMKTVFCASTNCYKLSDSSIHDQAQSWNTVP